jgi:hypothetical protein
MDFSIQSLTLTTRYRAENIGTPNLKFRVDGESIPFAIIMDFGSKKAYSFGFGWVDVSENFSGYSARYKAELDDILARLSGLEGGELSYTDPTTGATVRFYEVSVNLDIPDSVFQPT